jgi:hypothetical protein
MMMEENPNTTLACSFTLFSMILLYFLELVKIKRGISNLISCEQMKIISF